MKKVNTREEWLRHAVEELDAKLFNGDLDLANHAYQISTAAISGKALFTCFQPSDNEDLKMDEFFPTTITIDHTITDMIELLGNLALCSIHAFFNEKRSSTKEFKGLANKYYFDKPYKEYHPTDYLLTILDEVYTNLKNDYGEYPGKPIIIKKNEPKEKKISQYVLVCPECKFEIKVKKKMMDEHNGRIPTCGCGTLMELQEEEDKNTEKLDE